MCAVPDNLKLNDPIFIAKMINLENILWRIKEANRRESDRLIFSRHFIFNLVTLSEMMTASFELYSKFVLHYSTSTFCSLLCLITT